MATWGTSGESSFGYTVMFIFGLTSARFHYKFLHCVPKVADITVYHQMKLFSFQQYILRYCCTFKFDNKSKSRAKENMLHLEI